MTRLFALLVLVCTLLLAGCRLGGEGPEAPEASGRDAEPRPVSPRVSVPAESTSVVPAEDAGDLALATSQALYDEAPVVLVAAADDLRAQGRAASVAVPLGAPVLLVPPAGPEPAEPSSDGPVADELDRLGATTLMTFDDTSARWAGGLGRGPVVVEAPTDPADLAAVTGGPADAARTVDPGDVTTAVAALRRDESVVLDVEPPEPDDPDAEERAGPDDPDTEEEAAGPRALPAQAAEGDDLSRLVPAPPLDTLLVLAPPDEAKVAAAATARAAGARVLVLEEADPRADEEAIAALSEQPPETVMAVGDDFGEPDRLRARIEVAETGVELPGGGQVLFPARRMVALYGNPGLPVLGALGEQPLEEAIRRAQDVAADYERLSDVPVVPTFEIIATIASAGAGSDGQYSDVTPVDELRPWVDAAADEGFYVVLDLQPGRNDFLSQAQHYEELLVEPHVGLALDPEWRLEPDQFHLEQIGSVDAEEVNEVITWLADLTREHRLPQKLLVLHQFSHAMITNRDAVDTSRDELAVMIHADGHGTPGDKLETWGALTDSAPPDVFWGWKNFYDEDTPTWSAEETLGLEPDPLFVSYQ